MNKRDLAKRLYRLAKEIAAADSIFKSSDVKAVMKKMEDSGWVEDNLPKMVKMVDAMFQKGARRSGLDFDDFVEVYFDREADKHSKRLLKNPVKWQPIYDKAYKEKDKIMKYREAINRLDDVFERYRQFETHLILNTLAKAAHTLGGFKLPMFF